MNGLTVEEKQMALQYVAGGADFMFIPSPELRSAIIKGDARATGINYVMTSILIKGEPIRLDSQMVVNYCKGMLCKNNTWLFDNGNIKVVAPRHKKPVKLKIKENEDIKNKKENNDEN